MAKYLFFSVILEILVSQVLSQCLRPPTYNILPRLIPDYIESPRIVEGPRFLEAPRTIDTPRYVETPRLMDGPRFSPVIISEPPSNNIIPFSDHQLLQPKTTTIITDCTPTVCKNLANTIQLMIVCNLLQNTKGGAELGVQLASPILNEVLSSSSLSCGCTNPISTSNISPNLVSSNAITSNVIAPRVIMPNVSGFPNTPVTNLPSPNGLLTNLMSLLGSGIQM